MKNDIKPQDASKLLKVLDDEIDKKCLELKERRRVDFLKKIFITGCIISIIFPILGLILGFSLINALIPIFVLQAFSLIILLPVLINISGEGVHNEKI